jgi:hypothetical protein
MCCTREKSSGRIRSNFSSCRQRVAKFEFRNRIDLYRYGIDLADPAENPEERHLRLLYWHEAGSTSLDEWCLRSATTIYEGASAMLQWYQAKGYI